MLNGSSCITRRLAAGIVAVTLGSAAALGAQQQAKPAESQKTTLTGCVERADQVISRETLGTTVDSQTFVLIKRDQAGKAQASAPVGTAGTAGEPATPQTMFRLEGADDSLNQHVGHTVELTGVVTAAAQQPSVANPRSGGTVQVESVRMLAETCKP